MTYEQASPGGEKRKVIVLGGGVGAMTAAFLLTDPKNPKSSSYDVTVHQMGFRLGGKGASGRNLSADYHGRIQEHGLHVWSGMYDNAFRVIKAAYAELDRPPGAPLRTWDEAFKKHSYVALMEKVGGKYVPWTIEPPENPAEPGTGGLFLPLWDYVIEAIEFALGLLHASSLGEAPREEDAHQGLSGDVLDVVRAVEGELERDGKSFASVLLHAAHYAALHLGETKASDEKVGLFRRAGAELLAAGLVPPEKLTHGLVGKLLGEVMRWLWARIEGAFEHDQALRRLWILFNFGFANVAGIIADKVWLRGFDSINGTDYAEWMGRHAFDDGGLMLRSPMVTGQYDGCFAYPDGDVSRASLEAGIGLRVNVRAFFTYRGAVMWKMQAGMGDAIFAPLYEVLLARGVKFEFFHRVKRIVPGPEGNIDQIVVGQQATVTREQKELGGYAPLVPVKGLPCWPSEPRYEQLEEGATLKEQGIDLESYDGKWKDVAELTLVRGADFDDVVCGISLGALPYVAEDVVTRSTKWKAAVDNVQTVATQGNQLWMTKSAQELGWQGEGEPVVSCLDYARMSPLDTWGDMSYLAVREDWPAPDVPPSTAYLCGPAQDAIPFYATPAGPKQPPEAFDQEAANGRAYELLLSFLSQPASWFWPKAVSDQGFDFRLLLDLRAGAPTDSRRLESQWIRLNVQPSERYVLSVAGSDRHRLPVHDPSEFPNLYLAGDWTRCTLNVGCVEAAAISGCLCANALSGYPRREDIVGVDF